MFWHRGAAPASAAPAALPGQAPAPRSWTAACLLLPAALFLAAALPSLQEPGFHAEEAAQVVAGWRLADPELGERMPGFAEDGWSALMTNAYTGALKPWLFAAVRAAAGPDPRQVRVVTVLAGLAALAAACAAVLRFYGTAAALAFGLALAADPALVLLARHDNAPAVLSLALRMGALAALAAPVGSQRARTFLAAALLGLSVWDKAHSVWVVLALAAAAPLLPRRLRERRLFAPALAGFAAGTLPLLLYNAVVPLDTLLSPGWLKPASVAAHLSSLGFWGPERWSSLWLALGGRGQYSAVSGVMAPAAGAWLPALWGALLGGLAVRAARRRPEALRIAGFWAAGAAGVFALALFSPRANFNHFHVVYPLPQLAAAALVGAAPAPAAALAVGAAAATAVSGFRRLSLFREDLARTGGGRMWYRGMREVARASEAGGGRVVTLSAMFVGPLALYSEGRLRIVQGTGEFTTEGDLDKAVPAAFGEPGTLFVAYRGGAPCCDPNDSLTHRWFDAWRARAGDRLERLAVVPYSDGSPWAEVWRLR